MQEFFEVTNAFFPSQPFEFWHIPYTLSIFMCVCLGFAGLSFDLFRRGFRYPFWLSPKMPAIVGLPIAIMTAIGIFYAMFFPYNFCIAIGIFMVIFKTAPLGVALVSLSLTLFTWICTILLVFTPSNKIA